MNANDKPIGAPDMHSETPTSTPEPTEPPKEKRKLNWKGFGIGIIAVIIIEFFAISMIQQEDPQLTIEQPTPTQAQTSPTVSPTQTPTSFQSQPTNATPTIIPTN